MNIVGSKTKKRVVLPSRPDPPTVAQVLEDIQRAAPFDPVFTLLDDSTQDARGQSGDSEVESRYQQSRLYLDLNEKLQEVKGQLARQREELRTAGERLDHDVTEVKRGLTL